MLKKLKNVNLFLVIMIVSFGFGISLQTVFADYLFSSQPKGISVGNTSVSLGSKENLFWGVIKSDSAGNFILLQDSNYTNKFKIGDNGDVTAAGNIEALGNMKADGQNVCLQNGTNCPTTISTASDLVAGSSVVSDAEVDNNITLDNITQITSRSHSNLQNLDADSHTQYLNVNGIRPMSGALTVNNNLILNGQAYISGSVRANNHVTHLPWQNFGSAPNGYIKLVTPIIHNESNMFSIHIFGYEYSGGSDPIDIQCVGYAYSGSTLINTQCYTEGTDIPVEIGAENRGSTVVVIRLGTSSQGWYYPQLTAEYVGWNAKDPSQFIWVTGETTPAQSGNTNNVFINDQSGYVYGKNFYSSEQGAWLGDITAVIAGTGLSGGGTSGSVTLNANTNYLQRRVSGICAVGSSIRVINADGAVVCEADDTGITTETDPTITQPNIKDGVSWTELSAIPGGFADNTDDVNDADSVVGNEIQTLGTSGNTITLSLGGGSVTAPYASNADTVDSQHYNANWPTTLANMQTAVSNDFHKLGGTDNVNDADASATNEIQNVIGNQGLTRDGSNNFGIKDCAGNQIIKRNSGDTAWECAADAAGAGMPAGTSGQTLRHDGSNWVGNSILYNNGTNVGIGTTAPRTRLEIGNDGAILATGTTDSGWTEPNLGAGTRMLWYPRKAAFRAGNVYGVDWDDANIGMYSIAMGYATIASGKASVALGNSATASGDWSAVALGYQTKASGNYSTALGNAITAQGENSFGIGLDSTYREITQNNTMAIMGGNVGIGTTAPGAKLEVAGQIKITGGSPAAGRVLTSNAVGLATWQDPASGADNLGNHTAAQNIKLGNFWLSGDGGNEGVFVNSSGKVGIGTNSPGYMLSLADTDTTPMINIWNNSATSQWTGMRLARGGTGDGTEKWFMGMNNSDGKLRFRRAGLSDDLVIDESGKVGIGTTAPDERLYIKNSDSTFSGIKFELSGAQSTYSLGVGDGSPFTNSFVFVAGSSQMMNLTSTGLYIGGVALPVNRLGVGGGVGIGSYSTTLAPSNGLIVSGNVGIGTTAPAGQLEVKAVTTSADGILRLNHSTNNTTTSAFDLQWQGGATLIGGIRFSNPSSNVTNMEFSNWNGSTRTVRMGIYGTNGNVGIGTTGPQTKLDVNGKIAVRGGPNYQSASTFIGDHGNATFTHNLGYIPWCLWTSSNENQVVSIRSISTTQVVLYGWSPALGQSTYVVVYCW